MIVDVAKTRTLIREAAATLPSIVEIPVAPWPKLPAGAHLVEFRLTYDGHLPPFSQRNKCVEENMMTHTMPKRGRKLRMAGRGSCKAHQQLLLGAIADLCRSLPKITELAAA